VQPFVVPVEEIRQDEDSPCHLRVLPPSGATDALIGGGFGRAPAPWNVRKEMRLVGTEETEVARRIPRMTAAENVFAAGTALQWGRRLYADGTEQSLRAAVEKYREALRYWKVLNASREYQQTQDYLAAAYGALLVRLIEQGDAEAVRKMVGEAVEFDAANSGTVLPRLAGWDSVAREFRGRE
jgi:hypothetical protein